MQITELLKSALDFDFLSEEEGLFLYEKTPLAELMFVANELRKKQKPDNKVTWQIDRNVNITNICIGQCSFCNFHCTVNSKKGYITTIEQYKQKIAELKELGGEQLLLQGGMHPRLGLSFYTDLFKELKKIEPKLKLHALGPPEIHHLARIEKRTYKEILIKLTQAGLDSLPGAGAEILSDRVRKKISPGKCTSQQWLEVMRTAHQLNLLTSATMMFGHIETPLERIKHLIQIRDLQAQKDFDNYGFLAFIPWTFQPENTKLQKETTNNYQISPEEYIRTIAISRILLPNIKNIQASWLTVGKNTAQMCLHAGANDFGSIMIEENVVSSAGSNYKFDKRGIQKAIFDAGFTPQLRNQKYENLIRN